MVSSFVESAWALTCSVAGSFFSSGFPCRHPANGRAAKAAAAVGRRRNFGVLPMAYLATMTRLVKEEPFKSVMRSR